MGLRTDPQKKNEKDDASIEPTVIADLGSNWSHWAIDPFNFREIKNENKFKFIKFYIREKKFHS